jgi:hypothetical protein
VLHAIFEAPAATYRSLQEKEAGGVKKVVSAGTVAVAMYCGRLPTVVVMPDMMEVKVEF